MQAWEISVIWSRVVFVFNSCPGPGVVQLHVGLVGHVGVHGVADSGYSNWCGCELCGLGCGDGCGGTGVVGSAAEASSIGFPVWVVFCSELHIVEETCR